MVSPVNRPRLVALISAGGTTLQNLIDQIADHRLSAEIVQVISSRSDVYGVERAKRAGLPVEVVKRSDPRFSDRIFDVIRSVPCDFIVMAGWLHLVKIPADYQYRVLNIHPALLPAFGGKGMYGHHVHEAVLEYGAKVSGCTVHFADDTYDTGPIIVQRTVPVLDDDTPDRLAKRVFEAECEAYPEAIRLLSTRPWKVHGRRITFGNSSA